MKHYLFHNVFDIAFTIMVSALCELFLNVDFPLEYYIIFSATYIIGACRNYGRLNSRFANKK